jgi:hypothetical protein
MVDEWWAEVDTTQNTLLYFSRSYRRKRILEFSTNKFKQYSMPNELVAKIKKHAKVLGAFLIPNPHYSSPVGTLVQFCLFVFVLFSLGPPTC